MNQEEKLKYCKDWIAKLSEQYSNLNSDREKALQFCNGDPSIVDIIVGRSQIVTSDMQDAIDAAKPDILEIVAGTDEPMKLEPVGEEDVEPVKRLQVLGNIQIRRRNKWYRVCNDFIDDSMKLKFGAIKYQWVKDKKIVDRYFENLDELEFEAKVGLPGATLVSDEEDKDGNRITRIAYDMSSSGIKLCAVPAERIKFPLDCRDFDDMPFCVEEVLLYKEQFIRQYGMEAFNKVKEIKESLQDSGGRSVWNERFSDVGGISFIWDEEADKYKAYECYFEVEVKGRMRPWVFVFAGDVTLLDEENRYGKPPYRGGSPFMLAHRLLGAGWIDYLEETQRQRTFFKRQIFDRISMSNYRRNFVNIEASGLNIDDYFNNNVTQGLIRCTGNVDQIKPEQIAPMLPEVFQFWEMLNIEKDAHIPVPRSYSGVNPDVLNKTYRGQAQQIGQSSKKLLMMIRGYMEDVFGPLFLDVLDCIEKFMDKSEKIRYLNQDYEISPDNIVGRYDLVVNVGLGNNDKNDQVVKLQQFIGLLMQLKSQGSLTVTDQNIHYVLKELAKAMGFLNTSDFVTDPQLKQLVMQLLEMTGAMVQQLQQAPQLQPEAGIIGQQMMELMQQIMAGIGLDQQEQKDMQAIKGAALGGFNMEGTMPGQEPASIPNQPMQPGEPSTTITGGGYFA